MNQVSPSPTSDPTRTTRNPVLAFALLAAVAAWPGACSKTQNQSAATTAPATSGLNLDAAGDGSGSGDGSGGADGTLADGKAPGIEAIVCAGANDKHECDTYDECASGQYCDPCTKTCKKSRSVCDPCMSDAECAGAENGSMCIPYAKGGNFCGQVCVGDAGCGPAFACKAIPGSANKQCVPKNGTCAPGSGLCKHDKDCPFQFICNADYGACTKGCVSDLSCPQTKEEPKVCSLGHCVTPCEGDGDCAGLNADAKCFDQHCKNPNGCIDSSECPKAAGDVNGKHCALATHTCVPGCEADADCQDAGLKCESGKCVVKGCTMNYHCSYGKICDLASGLCQDPTLPYCGPCDDQDQNVTACGGKPALCSKIKDDKGTELGPYCFLPCSTDPTGPCPQGYGCQEVKDDKGAVVGKVCFRQCQYTPAAPSP